MQRHTPCLVAVAATLYVAVACVAPPSPSGPSSVRALEIRGTNLMMIGGRGRLTAWRYADGEAREVQAGWTTDNDVISIGGGGEVTARRLGKATVHARHQDLTGTGTVHVVASVAGMWQGSVSLVDCWEPSITLPSSCRDQRPATAPLVLTVSQSAAADLGNITGTISVFSPPATGRFAGLFDADGTFFVQGHVERAQDRVQGGVSFRWHFDGDQLAPMNEPDDMSDALMTVTGTSESGAVLFTEDWKIGRLTR